MVVEQRIQALIADLDEPRTRAACDPAYRASTADLLRQALEQWRMGVSVTRKALLRASAAAKLNADEREALGL